MRRRDGTRCGYRRYWAKYVLWPACGYNRPMGTKRKARKLVIPRVSKTARESSEIVALLRELREKMGLGRGTRARQQDDPGVPAYARLGHHRTAPAPRGCRMGIASRQTHEGRAQILGGIIFARVFPDGSASGLDWWALEERSFFGVCWCLCRIHACCAHRLAQTASQGPQVTSGPYCVRTLVRQRSSSFLKRGISGCAR